MCIAIVKKANATISDDTLKQCWTRNPDGAGIAYPYNGEVVIEKGFFKFETFLKRYKQIVKNVHSNILLHFRISTSGLVDKENCHPHRVNSKLVMIHNGVLHNVDVPAKSKVSDTVLYCRNYLQKLPDGFIYNDVIREFITDNIGSYNKFCFLDADGNYFICNEKAGVWDNDVWYSNTTYKEPKPVKKISYSKYSSAYAEGWYDKYYGTAKAQPDVGFGKVKKYSKWAALTEEERLLLRDDAELFDTVEENIYNLEDSEVIEIGETPFIHLLTGDVGTYKELCSKYNASAVMSLNWYCYFSKEKDELNNIYKENYMAVLKNIYSPAVSDKEYVCPECGWSTRTLQKTCDDKDFILNIKRKRHCLWCDTELIEECKEENPPEKINLSDSTKATTKKITTVK